MFIQYHLQKFKSHKTEISYTILARFNIIQNTYTSIKPTLTIHINFNDWRIITKQKKCNTWRHHI